MDSRLAQLQRIRISGQTIESQAREPMILSDSGMLIILLSAWANSMHTKPRVPTARSR